MIGFTFIIAGFTIFIWQIANLWNNTTISIGKISFAIIAIILSVFGISKIAQKNKILPALFTFLLFILLLETLLRIYQVPAGLIPTPSRVFVALWTSKEVLWADTIVTFINETLLGYAIGVILGITMAIIANKFAIFRLLSLPYISIFSSIPIVALAPISIKILGIEWFSKTAIVALVVLFPIFINTLRGLMSADSLQKDLLKTYSSRSVAIFRYLESQLSLPFLFNALKLSTTLALIAAIVGEFFGTDGKGLGFRIQIEVGRFNFDIVWACIIFASVLGILFYYLIGLIERLTSPWQVNFRRIV